MRQRPGPSRVSSFSLPRSGQGDRRPNRAARRAINLVGRDLAPLHVQPKPHRRFLPLLLIGTLLAALCLTALRIDLIRQRYDLAAAMREEKQLLEERRQVTARVRSLRDPARLAALAQSLGFERPSGVILVRTPAGEPGNRP